jgi:hypothetical protein
LKPAGQVVRETLSQKITNTKNVWHNGSSGREPA